ncbi:MAG TPA: hypothetical protein VEK55_12425 [Xanthobacteraceae bacterium]|nr:hypothetical protein [Xanthobacteraceae bacterium]
MVIGEAPHVAGGEFAPAGSAMSSQPRGVVTARSRGRSRIVVIADSTMAGPSID